MYEVILIASKEREKVNRDGNGKSKQGAREITVGMQTWSSHDPGYNISWFQNNESRPAEKTPWNPQLFMSVWLESNLAKTFTLVSKQTNISGVNYKCGITSGAAIVA